MKLTAEELKLVSKLHNSGLMPALIQFFKDRLVLHDKQLRVADSDSFKRAQGRAVEVSEIIDAFSERN